MHEQTELKYDRKIEEQTDGWTDKQTYRQSDGWTDKQRERQIYKQLKNRWINRQTDGK